VQEQVGKFLKTVELTPGYLMGRFEIYNEIYVYSCSYSLNQTRDDPRTCRLIV